MTRKRFSVGDVVLSTLDSLKQVPKHEPGTVIGYSELNADDRGVLVKFPSYPHPVRHEPEELLFAEQPELSAALVINSSSMLESSLNALVAKEEYKIPANALASAYSCFLSPVPSLWGSPAITSMPQEEAERTLRTQALMLWQTKLRERLQSSYRRLTVYYARMTLLWTLALLSSMGLLSLLAQNVGVFIGGAATVLVFLTIVVGMTYRAGSRLQKDLLKLDEAVQEARNIIFTQLHEAHQAHRRSDKTT